MIAKKKSERAIFLHGQGQAVGSVVLVESLGDSIHLLLVVLANLIGDDPIDPALDHVAPLAAKRLGDAQTATVAVVPVTGGFHGL